MHFRIPNFPANWTVVPQDQVVASAMPDTANYDLYDDQHVCAKLEQLRADTKIVEETDSLIEMVEKSLKKTSGTVNYTMEQSNFTTVFRFTY
jgi:hypothetical protein